jgi:nucleotide-binding universal stress UspA family protein
MFKHLLIPTDQSEHSELAVKRGIALAQSLGARVTVLASSPPFRVLATDPAMITDTREEYEKAVEATAWRCLQSAEDVARTLSVDCDTAHWLGDHPHRAIIATAQARACDVIIMASHGRRGAAATVLGTETEKVLARSKIPVLVWR